MNPAPSPHNLVNHFIQYGRYYLPSFVILIGIIATLVNVDVGKPSLVGEESYYHLITISHLEKLDLYAAILKPIRYFLPEQFWVIIPILISASTIFLGHHVLQRLRAPPQCSFFFLFFTVISPSFLLSTISFTSYSLFLFFTTFGLLLLYSHRPQQGASVVPFLTATLIDTASGILLLLLLLISTYYTEQKLRTGRIILLILVSLAILFNSFFLNLPFLIGPFHSSSTITDLISDLGGSSGVSFFLILLAVIGTLIAWRRKESRPLYLIGAVLIPLYAWNSTMILPLTLLISFFAALALCALQERNWSLESLKKFTLLILMLGLLFSLLTFTNRIELKSPLKSDQNALRWIAQNVPPDTRVFSAPENSYFLSYFSGKKAISYPHQQDSIATNLTRNIASASYITTLFPLLEKNNIHLLYLTPRMRAELPPDQGLLFLLKNERFKMLYSDEGTEVWVFQ